MNYLLIVISLLIPVQQVRGPIAPEEAKRAAYQWVRFYKDVSIGEPFYQFNGSPDTVLAHTNDLSNTMLRSVTGTWWQFPVIQRGKVVESVGVVYDADDKQYEMCGTQKMSDYLRAFLEFRDSLKPEYNLADLHISGCGHFWVIHKNLLAVEVIPVDNEAWLTLTGKHRKFDGGWKVGKRYQITDAIPNIRRAAIRFIESRELDKSVVR